MKKILMLLFSIVFIVTLTSCDNDDNVLKVGMDLTYPPFETTDDNENPAGISVDIAKAFGEYLGQEVKIVNLDFSAIIPALETGEIDIAIASMSITEKRKNTVDFSDPYMYFKLISLVNKEYANQNSINSDSTSDDILAVENTEFVGIISQVSTTIPESLGFNVKKVETKDAAILNISNGLSDVFVMSAEVVANGNVAYPDDTLVVWDPISVNQIGMAVKKGNTELVDKANAFIKTFFDDNGLADDLHNKYDDTISQNIPGANMDFYLVKPSDES